MCVGARDRTFGLERVDMAAGLDMVDGQVCDAARSGAAWLHSGSTLQYSTFWSLQQGTLGADCGMAVDGGRWPVARNCRCRLPGVSCQWSVARGQLPVARNCNGLCKSRESVVQGCCWADRWGQFGPAHGRLSGGQSLKEEREIVVHRHFPPAPAVAWDNAGRD